MLFSRRKLLRLLLLCLLSHGFLLLHLLQLLLGVVILLQGDAHKLAHAVDHLGNVLNAHESGRHADLRRKLDKLLQNSSLLRLFLRAYAQLNADGDLRNAIWKGHYLGGGTAELMLRVPFDPEFAQRNHNAVLFGAYASEKLAWAGQRPTAMTLIDRASRIGVENDSLADLYLSSLQGGRLRDSIKHYPNSPAAARALLAGDVDAVFAPQGELDWALAGHGQRIEPLAAPGLIKSQWEIGMATKESLRDLAWAVTDVIEALRQSGELERIYQRHQVRFLPPAAH